MCVYILQIWRVICVAGSTTQCSITREDAVDLVAYSATGLYVPKMIVE
jgi:hypothetical protein